MVSFGQQSGLTRYADLAETDQSFGDFGRLENITHKKADTVFADYDYTWDNGGRITEIDYDFLGTAYDDVADFSYDDTSQLTAADYTAQTDEAYDYDDNGNRDTGYTTGVVVHRPFKTQPRT